MGTNIPRFKNNIEAKNKYLKRKIWVVKNIVENKTKKTNMSH